MLKKILAMLAMLYAAASFAAVDVNKATAVELDGIKGIGPGISGKILDERKKGGSFKDWNDFIERVKGIGEANAIKFSAEGMTVNGAGFTPSAAAPAAKKEDKKAAKAEAKPKTDEAKAKKDAGKQMAAKDDKKDTKAEAAKPAASAPKK